MDVRDSVVDYVCHWSTRTEIAKVQLIRWLGIGKSKFYEWSKRYGKANEHNALLPRDHWLEDWESTSIINYFESNPLEGYRRLTYMMMDADIIAVSPSTTYRVLRGVGLLDRWNSKPSKKGTGFIQPLKAHEHWHVDISYINLRGTFYYLCTVLDGCSRYIVHWDIKESMKEADVELIIQKARERYPEVKPRVITDNGPQFIAKDFKEFIRLTGMSHVRTSPYYPQSNGKIERWHKTLKTNCIRSHSPETLDEAKQLIGDYIEYYNTQRLHSAIGYVTPETKLEGRETEVFKAREDKLAAARERRKEKRLKGKSITSCQPEGVNT